MKNLSTAAIFLALLASCSSAEKQLDASKLITTTVNGRSYDVSFDPYRADHAVIFSKRSIVLGDLPKAEIVAQATPCVLDENPTNYHFSDMEHPTRSDLENLGWVSLDCS